jgi:hypothetical protein
VYYFDFISFIYLACTLEDPVLIISISFFGPTMQEESKINRLLLESSGVIYQKIIMAGQFVKNCCPSRDQANKGLQEFFPSVRDCTLHTTYRNQDRSHFSLQALDYCPLIASIRRFPHCSCIRSNWLWSSTHHNMPRANRNPVDDGVVMPTFYNSWIHDGTNSC